LGLTTRQQINTSIRMDKGKTSITIRLDKDFHKRIKLLAVERDTTVKGLFVGCLNRLLEEEERKKN